MWERHFGILAFADNLNVQIPLLHTTGSETAKSTRGPLLNKNGATF